MRVIRFLKGGLAVGVLASIAASAQAAPAPSPASQRNLDVPAGSLIAPGKAPDLSLLYTGAVAGYLDPCG